MLNVSYVLQSYTKNHDKVHESILYLIKINYVQQTLKIYLNQIYKQNHRNHTFKRTRRNLQSRQKHQTNHLKTNSPAYNRSISKPATSIHQPTTLFLTQTYRPPTKHTNNNPNNRKRTRIPPSVRIGQRRAQHTIRTYVRVWASGRGIRL